jgi:hypothetical protein
MFIFKIFNIQNLYNLKICLNFEFVQFEICSKFEFFNLKYVQF